MYTTFLSLIMALLMGLNPFATKDVEPVSPAPITEVVWQDEVLNSAGIALPEGAHVYMTNQYNCGAELSLENGGEGEGGCTYTSAEGNKVIVVSPQLANTEWGVHILLHEVGHAYGLGECAAEYFAHRWSNPELWAYPECNPAAPVQPVAPVQPTVTAAEPMDHITAPEVPSIPPYTDTDPVPPVVEAPTLEACSEFELRAEDGTCVPSNYWDEPTKPIIPPHAEPNPVDCDNLTLGDAHAGIGLVCGLDKK